MAEYWGLLAFAAEIGAESLPVHSGTLKEWTTGTMLQHPYSDDEADAVLVGAGAGSEMAALLPYLFVFVTPVLIFGAFLAPLLALVAAHDSRIKRHFCRGCLVNYQAFRGQGLTTG